MCARNISGTVCAIAACATLASIAEAGSLEARWATQATGGVIEPPNLSNSLGPPDGAGTAISGTTATWSMFDAPTTALSAADLAALFGLTTTELEAYEFIAIDMNGAEPGTFESCRIVFGDGVHTRIADIVFDADNQSSGANWVSVGVSATAFNDAFGTSLAENVGLVAVDLEDVDPSAATFSAEMIPAGDADHETPEVDALGLLGPGPACLEDIDGDGFIGFSDLNIVVSAFNTIPGDPNYNPDADLDGNDFVGFADVNLVLSVFNTDCP